MIKRVLIFLHYCNFFPDLSSTSPSLLGFLLAWSSRNVCWNFWLKKVPTIHLLVWWHYSGVSFTDNAESEAGSEHNPLVLGDGLHVQTEQGSARHHVHGDPGHETAVSVVTFQLLTWTSSWHSHDGTPGWPDCGGRRWQGSTFLWRPPAGGRPGRRWWCPLMWLPVWTWL